MCAQTTGRKLIVNEKAAVFCYDFDRSVIIVIIIIISERLTGSV